MRILLLNILLFILAFSSSAHAENFYLKAVEANNAYELENFNTALELYQQLYRADYLNSALYYNLANTYFKLERYPEAIAWYRMALKYSPRDTALQTNLQLARSKIDDPFPGVKSSNIASFFAKISLAERQGLALAFLTITVLLLALNAKHKGKGLAIKLALATSCLIFSLILVSIFGIQTNRFGEANFSFNKTPSAVIIGDNAIAYAGAGENFQVVSKMNAGVEVSLAELNQNWAKIYLPRGRIGWLPISALFIVDE